MAFEPQGALCLHSEWDRIACSGGFGALQPLALVVHPTIAASAGVEKQGFSIWELVV